MFPGYHHFGSTPFPSSSHPQHQQQQFQHHLGTINYPPPLYPFSSTTNDHPSSSSSIAPTISAFHNHQHEQERRNNGRDTLLSMRKHRSLDGGQFLAQLANPLNSITSTAYNPDHQLPSSIDYMMSSSNNNPQPPMFQQQVYGTAGSSSAPNRQQQPAFDQSQLLLTRAPGPAPTSTSSSTYHQQQSSAATTTYPPPPPTSYHYSHQMPTLLNTTSMGGGGNAAFQQAPFVDTSYGGNCVSGGGGCGDHDDDPLANAWLYYQPISAHSILQQTEFDLHALRREFASLCDRYNYLAASVRTFWAPELQRERQRRKEEAFRADQLDQRLSKMNSETQIIRNELDRMHEDGDSGIGRPYSHPRDFTDHTITLHEWQTLKTKLERSELGLAERTRELQNAELRAKCAEEQKEEVERRNDILSRSSTANESQLRLLQEDLNVLRGKLELKNQQLDTREKANKKLEAEMESLRLELKESQQIAMDGERKVAQLTRRIDQMEQEMREQNVQMEKLRQLLLQQPSTRAEMELQQKLDNALGDRRKMEQLVDQLRQHNETERQQQLQQFLQERDQLQANIAYLKKELADRHMLISSQSEKISQLDSAVKNAAAVHQQNEGGAVGEQSGRAMDGGGGGKEAGGESKPLEEHLHQEVDRLLKRVQQLEREKAELVAKRAAMEGGGSAAFFGATAAGITAATADMTPDERANSLGQRIADLEEALRESVECTAEKDKALSEQKRLVEKLSSQLTEMFESGAAIGSQQRQARDALAQLGEAQRQLEEERQQRQRQVSTVRKELGMALVVEKEAAISLVQSCCPVIEAVPGLREKLDTLQRQKEALKHALLMSSSTRPEMDQQHQMGTTTALGNVPRMEPPSAGPPPPQRSMLAMVQPGRPMSAAAAIPSASYSHHPPHYQQQQASVLTQPIRIQTAGLHHYQNGYGISAPASLNLHTPIGGFDDFGQQVDEEGIWA